MERKVGCRICNEPRVPNLEVLLCKEHYNEAQALRGRNRRRKSRQMAIDFLGGKCNVCGWSDVRALQIDHVNGGGSKEHKLLGEVKVYRRVLAYPNEYQLLCANHNSLKRYENSEF